MKRIMLAIIFFVCTLQRVYAVLPPVNEPKPPVFPAGGGSIPVLTPTSVGTIPSVPTVKVFLPLILK